MTAIKRYYKKAVPVLALMAVAVLVAVVFRAFSIAREAGSEGIKIPGASLIKYIWLELKAVFKFSRY